MIVKQGTYLDGTPYLITKHNLYWVENFVGYLCGCKHFNAVAYFSTYEDAMNYVFRHNRYIRMLRGF